MSRAAEFDNGMAWHWRSRIALRRVPLLMLLLAIGMALCLPLAAQLNSANPAQKIAIRTVALPNSPVTPVSGRNWLNHVGAFLNDTSMGKTGAYGPAPPEEEIRTAPGATSWAGLAAGTFASGTIALTGADLYRLECQGCHRTDGKGVPPEINSMINPVRATSAELIRKHMEEIGAPMGSKAARELAAQSQMALVQRISHGGVHMPGFLDLNAVEIEALVAYVDQLAGVPGAEKRQIRLNEPSMRVGEHLVKATCHICHDATGPHPTPEQMLEGEIPPLSTLTRSKSLEQFVQKVMQGTPVTMGVLELRYRGRMPVFYYIRPDEAAAAYLYLSMYPPETVQVARPQAEAVANSATAKRKSSAGVVNEHK